VLHGARNALPGERWQRSFLVAWHECDEWDKPTGVYILACVDCLKTKFVDRHPRLYIGVDLNAATPGLMPSLCLDCVWHDGVTTCTHPRRAALSIEQRVAGMAILCGRGRGASGRMRLLDPPTRCEGREPGPPLPDDDGGE
jgi:hypothetical protein